MEVVRFDQFLVLLLFMAALGLLWWYVLRNKKDLAQRFHRGRRLQLVESLHLGGHGRATLLIVDQREFLLVHGKTGANVLHPLGERQPENEITS